MRFRKTDLIRPGSERPAKIGSALGTGVSFSRGPLLWVRLSPSLRLAPLWRSLRRTFGSSRSGFGGPNRAPRKGGGGWYLNDKWQQMARDTALSGSAAHPHTPNQSGLIRANRCSFRSHKQDCCEVKTASAITRREADTHNGYAAELYL